MRNPVLVAAVAAGKVSGLATRILGRGGGTALPGLIAQAVYPGVLRDLFIIHDARRYFRDAWQNHWQSVSPDNLPMYRSYRVDLQILVEAGVISAGAIGASSP